MSHAYRCASCGQFTPVRGGVHHDNDPQSTCPVAGEDYMVIDETTGERFWP